MKLHPPGLLAMASSENARYSACWASVIGLARPEGSPFYNASSLSIAESLNHIVENVFLPRPALQWIFFMNDDHVYPADALMRLLDHEVFVVSGLYCEKTIPFGPVLYSAADDENMLTRLPLPTAPAAGLTPIAACGDGCLLIRRSVFELVDAPWWEYGATDEAFRHDRVDHDVSFCAKLREHGIPLFADLSVVADHLTPIALRPMQQPDGSWHAGLVDRQGGKVEILTVPATEGVV